ncbi:WD repeat-containing protein 43 [Dispira simplex]|nr:WD repeat-containing protein 43 [Dispira simplex]
MVSQNRRHKKKESKGGHRQQKLAWEDPTQQISAKRSQKKEANVRITSINPTGKIQGVVTQCGKVDQFKALDTATGKTLAEYTSSKVKNFNSLSWGKLALGEDASVSANGIEVVAISQNDGDVTLYSVQHQRTALILKGKQNLPVLDFAIHSEGKLGYAILQDSTLVKWDLQTGKPLIDDKGYDNFDKVLLSPNNRLLALTGEWILLLDTDTLKPVARLVGHARRATSLEFTADGRFLVSAAAGSRFINLWDCKQLSQEDPRPLVLSTTHDIESVRVSPQGHILAVQQLGPVSLWYYATKRRDDASQVTTNGQTEIVASTVQRVTSRQPDATIWLNVDGKDKSDTAIPALEAAFVPGSDPSQPAVLVAYGSQTRVQFSRADIYNPQNRSFLTEVKVSCTLDDDLQFTLQPSLINKPQASSQERAQFVSVSSLLPAGEDLSSKDRVDDKDKPIEERLRGMATSDDENAAPKGTTTKSKVVASLGDPDGNGVGGLTNTLIQALRTHDQNLLNEVLNQKSQTVIKRTVVNLPTSFIIPLLNALAHQLTDDNARLSTMLYWLDKVLSLHTSYLIAIPELVLQIQGLYTAFESRIASRDMITALCGRLDLVHSQVNKQRRALKQPKAAANARGGNLVGASSTFDLAIMAQTKLAVKQDVKVTQEHDLPPYIPGEEFSLHEDSFVGLDDDAQDSPYTSVDEGSDLSEGLSDESGEEDSDEEDSGEDVASRMNGNTYWSDSDHDSDDGSVALPESDDTGDFSESDTAMDTTDMD